MSELSFDFNIDKHNKATVVIICPRCKREVTHHLDSLEPDMIITCPICDEKIIITQALIDQAQAKYEEIKRDEDGLIG